MLHKCTVVKTRKSKPLELFLEHVFVLWLIWCAPDETAKKENPKVAICHRLREVFSLFSPRVHAGLLTASTGAVILLHFYDENNMYLHPYTQFPCTCTSK